MSRRSFSGFSLGPVIIMVAIVIIVNLWNHTQAPLGDDRIDGDFQILGAVRLEENPGNDGDSFHIQHSTEVDVYRLYFVDACEKSDRFRSRLGHQARYFGELKERDVLDLGAQARDQTLTWLGKEPFEIYTRGERVMNGERLYAMVRFPQAPEGQQWLCERLVQAGLARIYTRGTALADGRSRAAFEKHLRKIESEAKKAKRGAWSLSGS